MKQFILKPIDSDLITQTGTTWEVASDSDFNDIVFNVVNSATYLYTWFIDVAIIPGDKLYVRAKRHFDAGGSSDWIQYEELVSGYGEIFLKTEESSVEIPMLRYDVKIENNNNELNVYLTDMRSSGVAHHSSSYVVKRLNGDVVYADINNTEDKIHTIIDLSNCFISPFEPLILCVTQTNENNVQSQYGEFNIIPDEVKIYPIYPLEDILTSVDYKLKLANPDNILYDIYIKDESKHKELFILKNINSTEVLIPAYTLNPNETYELEIINEDGLVITHIPFTASNDNDIFNKVNYDLDLKFTDIVGTFNTVFNNFYIESLNYKTGLFLQNTGENGNLSFISKRSIEQTVIDFNITDDLQTDNLNIIRLNDNRSLIVTIGTGLNVMMYVINHNVMHDIVNLYDSYNLSDSLEMFGDVGFNTIVFNRYNGLVYFIASIDGTFVLCTIDPLTGTINELADLLEQEFVNYTLTQYDTDYLMITASGLDGNSNPASVYRYNTKKNDFHILTSMDVEYENSRLCSFTLRDGNVLFLDTIENSTLDYLIYDVSDSSFRRIPIDPTYEHSNKIFVNEFKSIFSLKYSDNETLNHFGQ